MDLKDEYFDDLSRILKYWSERAAGSLTDESGTTISTKHPEAHLRLRQAIIQAGISPDTVATVLRDILYGTMHSMLVGLDGGTKLAESGLVYLVDEEGKEISRNLHEEFEDYLHRTETR